VGLRVIHAQLCLHHMQWAHLMIAQKPARVLEAGCMAMRELLYGVRRVGFPGAS
jgi:hypothetical protein